MPRTYISKREKKYTKDNLLEAVAEVKKGHAVHKIAQQFDLPTETLRRWVVKESKISFGGGRPPVLNHNEEELIVVGLEQCAKSGWPCDRADIRTIVKTHLDGLGKQTRFKDNIPGEDWLASFASRWKHRLTTRKPEILTKGRAEGLTNDVVNTFFNLVEKSLKDNNMEDAPDLAERLHNCDEAGLATNPISKKVFIPKTDKNAYLKAPGAGKASYSVLFCISANGDLCPPFVVYKSKYLYQSWTEGGPRGTSYGLTKSGWMEDTVFEDWFVKHYVKWAADFRKPCILFLDGHGSHLTYKVVESALANQIVMICLPPHTSHALQPCDVALFRPLKVCWKDVLKSWFRETRLQNVDKAVFPTLLCKLWVKIKPSNAVAGFAGSGLYPLDRSRVQPRIVLSQVHPQQNNVPDTPRKTLREAIILAITPSPSEETKAAMVNSKKKRKRVQAKAGEVLTAEDVIKRLKEEESAREEKKKKKETKNKAGQSNFQIIESSRHKSKTAKRKSISKKLVLTEEYDEESDENKSITTEDEDSVPCISCGKLYGEESIEHKPHWVSCDICTVWTCVHCLPEDFELSEDYFCMECQ